MRIYGRLGVMLIIIVGVLGFRAGVTFWRTRMVRRRRPEWQSNGYIIRMWKQRYLARLTI
jgi:hypothetical protein